VDVFLTRESVGWVVRVTIDRPGPAATPKKRRHRGLLAREP
jgi:hypothetical protein